MPNATNCGVSLVLALELDRNGNVSKKTMKLDREAQLTNSLLQGLYPGIHVATVDVPTEPLDSCEQAMVEQALTRIEIDGIRYSLVGASGSAKNGKFYAVESSFEKKLAERFRFSPQAAITYFGILVSSCKVLFEVPDCRVMVVDDHEIRHQRLPGMDLAVVVPETPAKAPVRTSSQGDGETACATDPRTI